MPCWLGPSWNIYWIVSCFLQSLYQWWLSGLRYVCYLLFVKAETCIALVLHAFCLVTVSAAWVIIWKVLETSLTHQPHCSSSGALIVHTTFQCLLVTWSTPTPQPNIQSACLLRLVESSTIFCILFSFGFSSFLVRSNHLPYLSTKQIYWYWLLISLEFELWIQRVCN